MGKICQRIHQTKKQKLLDSKDGAAWIHKEPILTVMEFLGELWQFIRKRKKYWMIPIIIVLAAVGILLVLSHGSAVAPFIYTLFWSLASGFGMGAPIRILGASGFYHYSAVALIEDEEIIWGAQEERFTRIKYDSKYPYNPVSFVLGKRV